MGHPKFDLRSRPQTPQARVFSRANRSPIGALSAMVEDSLRKEHQAHEAETRGQCDAVLALSTFQQNQALRLAQHDRSPAAREYLSSLLPVRDNAHTGGILPAMCDPYIGEQSLTWRLALTFGVVREKYNADKLLEDVRLTVGRKAAAGSVPALCVLALCNRKVPWRGAGREVRAAILLRSICDAMRGGTC